MNRRTLLIAASALAAALSTPTRELRAQWTTVYEQFYLPADHNFAFRSNYPAADRLFNAFDYGHAILYERLWTRPINAKQLLYLSDRTPSVPGKTKKCAQRWKRAFMIKPGVFRQAVCQTPMCVPSRYAMMLGLYPSQLGVYANSDSLSDAALPTRPLPKILQDAGYQTAGFGKTHWRRVIPSTRGFEIRAIGEPRNSLAYEQGAVMMDDDNSEPPLATPRASPTGPPSWS